MGKRNYKTYINPREAQTDPYEQYGTELIKWAWEKDETTGIITLLKGGEVYRRFRLASESEIKNTKTETTYMTETPCPIAPNQRLVRLKE